MVAKKNDLIDKRVKDSIESYTIELVPCITKLPLRGSDVPFKFLIKSIKGEFIDPNNIVLYLQFKIWRKGADGELKALEPGENITPYNGFLYTMFKVYAVINDFFYLTHDGPITRRFTLHKLIVVVHWIGSKFKAKLTEICHNNQIDVDFGEMKPTPYAYLSKGKASLIIRDIGFWN